MQEVSTKPLTVLAPLICARTDFYSRNPSKHVYRGDYEDSTGNLKRHANSCEPANTAESEAITAFANGATYSPARLRFLLAMWCASRHRPFAIVEDPEFKAILHMLYGRVNVPSRVTVSRDVQHIVDETMTRLIERFEVRYILILTLRRNDILTVHNRTTRARYTCA